MATHVKPPDQLDGLLATYRQRREAAGHEPTPDDVTVLTPTFVAGDDRTVRALVEPGVERLTALLRRKVAAWSAMLPAGAEGDAKRAILAGLERRFASFGYDQMGADRAVFGTPDACAERPSDWARRFGTQRFIHWFNPGGLVAHRDVLAAMERFADGVMPAVRSAEVSVTTT